MVQIFLLEYWWCTYKAAPRAVPASPEAG